MNAQSHADQAAKAWNSSPKSVASQSTAAAARAGDEPVTGSTALEAGNAVAGASGRPAATGTIGVRRQSTNDRSQDTSHLQDALASAGVDLQQEELNMTIQSRHAETQAIDAAAEESSRFCDFLNAQVLEKRIQKSLSSMRLSRSDPAVASLLTLSTRERLSQLLQRMILLCKHRTQKPPRDAIMVDNVRHKLKELVERDRKREEQRSSMLKKRKADVEAREAEKEAAAFAEDGGAAPRKKPKKDTSSKSVNEETLKRLADQTAHIATGFGGRQYSWLSAESHEPETPAIGGGFGIVKKKSKHSRASAAETSSENTASSHKNEHKSRRHKILPYLLDNPGIVTMRDALLALEIEQEHGLNIPSGSGESRAHLAAFL